MNVSVHFGPGQGHGRRHDIACLLRRAYRSLVDGASRVSNGSVQSWRTCPGLHSSQVKYKIQIGKRRSWSTSRSRRGICEVAGAVLVHARVEPHGWDFLKPDVARIPGSRVSSRASYFVGGDGGCEDGGYRGWRRGQGWARLVVSSIGAVFAGAPRHGQVSMQQQKAVKGQPPGGHSKKNCLPDSHATAGRGMRGL